MSIAVGYIPTEAGDRALTLAVSRAERDHRDLTIINVIRADRPGDARHASRHLLDRVVADAGERGVSATAVTLETANGDTFAASFLQAVAESGASLLVVGSRRDPDIPQHMMGLTLQQVVADARCSVLVA